MVEKVGSDDESEFDSVTSSQKSFLKTCPFADPFSRPTKSSDEMVETDAESTEILGNQISPAVVKTPILSFSSPTSLDSINDEDVFRTPPENASLSSSAADSEPRVMVSKLKSPSSRTDTTPISASSPSIPAENVRVLSNSVTEVVVSLSSPASVAANDVRVPGKHSPSPTAIGKTRALKNQPFTVAPESSYPASVAANNVRVPGKHSPSPTTIGKTRALKNQPITVATESSSQASVAVNNVRVPGKQSPSPTLIEKTRDLENQPITGVPKSSSPALNIAGCSGNISQTENSGGDLPFKEIIEALLRNSGENLSERDEKVSCVDILKKCGFKFL